jgi:hypothetical protein
MLHGAYYGAGDVKMVVHSNGVSSQGVVEQSCFVPAPPQQYG